MTRLTFRAARRAAPEALALGALLLATVTLGACDSSVDIAQTNQELSEQDAAIAAGVVAQAVADQSEGLMSDLYDMDAGLDAGGLVYTEGPLQRGRFGAGFDDRRWRDRRRQDGRVVYDSTTGTHRLQYTRRVETPAFERTISADLAYVFTDAAGAFVRTPRRDRDRIARIAFDGERAGTFEVRVGGLGGDRDGRGGHGPGGDRGGRVGSDSVRFESAFRREASWTLAGLTGATATFAGDQTSEGSWEGIAPGDTTGATEGSYTARLQATGVTITKADAAAGIEAAVTGTLQYEVVLRRVVGGQTEERTATGTLTLEGNGRALLRFLGLGGLYRLDLASGDVYRTAG